MVFSKFKSGLVGLTFLGLSFINSKAQDTENITKYSREANNLLETIKPKYSNIIYEKIALEKVHYPELVSEKVKELDNLIDESKKIIPKQDYKNYTKEQAKTLILKIDSLISNSPVSVNDDEAFIAIAKENNLPIKAAKMVDASGRIEYFIRWDPDEKHDAYNQKDPVNKGDFNFIALENVFFEDSDVFQKNSLFSFLAGKIKRPKLEVFVMGENITPIIRDMGERDLKYPEKVFFTKNGIVALSQNEILNKKAVKNRVYLANLTDNQILASAYFSHAFTAFGCWHFEKALDLLNKTIELDEKNIYAYWLRSRAYRHLHEKEKAMTDLNAALKLNEDPLIYIQKAFYLLDNPKKAFKQYEKAKKFGPEAASYAEFGIFIEAYNKKTGENIDYLTGKTIKNKDLTEKKSP